MKIRSANTDDAGALALLAGALGYPMQVAEMASRLAPVLADPEQAVLVAEWPGAGVTGWIHICRSPRLVAQPFAELGGLIVDERYRGSGAGRALLAAAEDWARAQGYSRLRIRSNTTRRDAHRFYERMGYDRTKTQQVYDKALLQTKLPHSARSRVGNLAYKVQAPHARSAGSHPAFCH